MYQPANTAVVTASRARWAEFAAKLAAGGRGDVANYVLGQVGTATGAYAGVALDRERFALWTALMSPRCPLCGMALDGAGACPTGCDLAA
jgi:hypothetical protein